MCISLAELISSNFFASKVGAGNGFLHGRLPHDFYFLSWNEYILLYIEIVQFIYALFPQQPSPSHFFSRVQKNSTFFVCGVARNKSRAEPTFWHCIWHWKYGTCLCAKLMLILCIKRLLSDFRCGGQIKVAGGFVGQTEGGCILPEHKSLFELHVTSNKMWSRLWFDREKWNEFCFLSYWLFLPQKQIRSQWQVW